MFGPAPSLPKGLAMPISLLLSAVPIIFSNQTHLVLVPHDSPRRQNHYDDCNPQARHLARLQALLPAPPSAFNKTPVALRHL